MRLPGGIGGEQDAFFPSEGNTAFEVGIDETGEGCPSDLVPPEHDPGGDGVDVVDLRDDVFVQEVIEGGVFSCQLHGEFLVVEDEPGNIACYGQRCCLRIVGDGYTVAICAGEKAVFEEIVADMRCDYLHSRIFYKVNAMRFAVQGRLGVQDYNRYVFFLSYDSVVFKKFGAVSLHAKNLIS